MLMYAVLTGLIIALALMASWLFQTRRQWHAERRFYQNYPDALVRISLPEGHIVRCNEKFATTLGYVNSHDCLLVNQFVLHFKSLSLSWLVDVATNAQEFPHEAKVVVLEQRDKSEIQMRVSIFDFRAESYLDLIIERQDSLSAFTPLKTVAQIRLDKSFFVETHNETAKLLFGPSLHAGRSVSYLIDEDFRQRIIDIIKRRMRHSFFSLPVPSLVAGGYTDRLKWCFSVLPQNELELVCVLEPSSSDNWRLLTSLMGSQAGLWELNLKTDYLDQSKDWLTFLGYGDRRSINSINAWVGLLHPDDREELASQIGQVRKRLIDRINVEYRIAVGRGVEVTVLTTGYVSKLSDDGTPLAIRGYHRVVETEDGAAQLSITSILKELGHDLSNQLALIIGFSQLIAQDTTGKIEEYANAIQSAAEKANQALENKIDNVEPEPGLYASINRFCDTAGICSVVHLKPDQPVDVDEDIVTKCLIEMTGGDGALSSTSDELRITTDFRAYPEAACSYCEAELDDVFLCLSVEDQSADVSREQMLQRTRAVFLTTDITDQVAESGGGFFNLSRLVHQAQGHLSLHSKANRTLLSIYLPEVRLRETVGGILVVDDEPQVSEYLKDILVRQGHRVTTRSNGIQALNLFKQNPGQFDLVITDQNMPGISIERIIREIHDVRPELPIIICSGYSASLTDVLAQKLGAAGFVKKPIDVGRLLSLVGSCISAVDRVKDGLVEYQS